jgi:hypothetical protein
VLSGVFGIVAIAQVEQAISERDFPESAQAAAGSNPGRNFPFKRGVAFN